MGLPWLEGPITLHSSREYNCTMSDAQCEFKGVSWRNWYIADHVYGYSTFYFMCAVIGIFTISKLLSTVSSRRQTKEGRTIGVWDKVVALMRFLSYKGFYLRGLKWYSPSVGVILLGLSGTVYFFGLTLGTKPYYWPNTDTIHYGDSPPLATRAGWMSLALLPFVILLSSKANYITVLTGVSHEKLQVFHRWTSWAMFILALIHTFPFIIYNISVGEMIMNWEMSSFYWTGVVALIFQTYLNIMSIGFIRNRFYEFFKVTHHIAICGFLVFLFIHCDFTLTSADYFIAALSLYAITLIFSFLRTSIQSLDAYAQLSLLPDQTIKVTIPTKISWKPGQHVFLKFYSSVLHSYTFHPFTICSLPEAGEMVFYIRPHKGITGTLKEMISVQFGKMAMSIDGPYGNRDVATTLQKHNKILLIAGGSGTGFLLPVLEALISEGGSGIDVRLVIAVRYSESATWVVEALEGVLGKKREGCNVKVDVQITDEGASSEGSRGQSLDITPVASGDNDTEKRTFASTPVVTGKSGINIVVGEGRPDLKALVGGAIDSARDGTSVGVTACGPSSMMLDVKDACAEAQIEVLKGSGAKGLWLHTEAFSW